MNTNLTKWESGGTRRIYVNAPALGETALYAYANEQGAFDIAGYIAQKGQGARIYAVLETACRAIEAKIRHSLGPLTPFAEVWDAL